MMSETDATDAPLPPPWEGWWRPTGHEEWHYFRSWRSLCYGQVMRGRDVPVTTTRLWEEFQPNCAECQRLRLEEVGDGTN